MSTIMNEKVEKKNYFSNYLVIYSMLLRFTTLLFVISFFVWMECYSFVLLKG